MVVIEGIVIGISVALFGGGIALLRTVYRMSGVIENGLTGELKDLTRDVRSLVEEQARQGVRIDSLYQRWGEG